MTAPDVLLYIVAGVNALFWLGVVPLTIVSLVVVAACRAFFGLPVIVWRGIEGPDRVANLVLKAAETAHAEEDEGADDEDEAGMLDRMRR